MALAYAPGVSAVFISDLLCRHHAQHTREFTQCERARLMFLPARSTRIGAHSQTRRLELRIAEPAQATSTELRRHSRTLAQGAVLVLVASTGPQRGGARGSISCRGLGRA